MRKLHALPRQLIKFSGVAAGEACTVVLRGSTTQMVDEAERSLHDALSVLSQTVKETRVVLGGGCSEMLMSCAVEDEARRVQGKRAIAAESFARALRQIPTILADNAGLDSSDLVTRLRAAHYEGKTDSGLSPFFVPRHDKLPDKSSFLVITRFERWDG